MYSKAADSDTKYLSELLIDTLDRVGASEYVRRLRQENAITHDLILRACGRLKRGISTVYTLGSFVEGELS